MPLFRFILMIVTVAALAALTVTAVLAFTGGVPSMLGLAILALIGLCTSFAFRTWSSRQTKKSDAGQ